MAKLLSYFNLCPIMDPKDFLGVAEGKEEGTIINTLGRNIIIIIKVCPGIILSLMGLVSNPLSLAAAQPETDEELGDD